MALSSQRAIVRILLMNVEQSVVITECYFAFAGTFILEC